MAAATVGSMALQAQDLTAAAPSKPWNISATVRGFYDDNYTTAPGNVPAGYPITKRSSWGTDLNPGVRFDLLRDLTTIRFSYDYDARYYTDRVDHKWDQSHNVTASLSHSFSERYKLELFDNFAVGQEPSLLSPGGTPSAGTYMRIDGSNIRNYAGAAFTSSFTEQLGSRIAYQNTFYEYDDKGHPASYSALLDRMEHVITLDLRWQYTPATLALVGYQFGYTDQTSNDKLDVNGLVNANARNRYDHYIFIGGDHDFNTQLSAKARVGAQIATYPNANKNGITGMDDSRIVPYADAMVQYKFAERNAVQLGVKSGLNQTDVAVLSATQATTTDSEALTLYASVTYALTPRLISMARAQWQMATFDGGFYNNQQDNYYTADLNLTYEINRYLKAEAGYAYDRLDSDLPLRSYGRNRIYFGLSANY
jgi:hypothetical protein